MPLITNIILSSKWLLNMFIFRSEGKSWGELGTFVYNNNLLVNGVGEGGLARIKARRRKEQIRINPE